MPKILLTLTLLLAPGLLQAETIKLLTENYPPFGYSENGKNKGSTVEFIDAMMKDAGLEHTIDIMPWARAIATAETQPNHCVFTTVHTVERDKRFKWVEPLQIGRTILIKKAGSSANPENLEQAKSFVIGTQRDDFTDDLLRLNNFPKVDLASDFDLTFKKLMLGRIDLMPISEPYFMKLQREGQPVERVALLAEPLRHRLQQDHGK